MRHSDGAALVERNISALPVVVIEGRSVRLSTLRSQACQKIAPECPRNLKYSPALGPDEFTAIDVLAGFLKVLHDW